MALVVSDNPNPADVQALDDAIYAFNVARTAFSDGRWLSIFLKDQAGAMYAGLSGHTWGGACEIKLLWIAEARRGQGLGSQMLAAAEDEARARGCAIVTLSSHSFQAPGFYKARGYQEVGRVEGYPRGAANVVLVKAL